MLIDLLLEDKGKPRIIGAPMPTIKVYAKCDGVISVMPTENDPERCEVNLIGMPSTVTAMERPESLVERVNNCYRQLGAAGSFVKFSSKGGPADLQGN